MALSIPKPANLLQATGRKVDESERWYQQAINHLSW